MKRLSIPIEQKELDNFRELVPRGMRAAIVRNLIQAASKVASYGPVGLAILLGEDLGVHVVEAAENAKRASEDPPDSDEPRDIARNRRTLEDATR